MDLKSEIINILHISDLQAGSMCLAEQIGNVGSKEKRILNNYERYADLIAYDLTTKVRVKPKILVFTGDITNKGQHKEYKRATTFLSTLVNRLNITWQNVLIVPGNHDLNRKILKDKYREKYPKTKIEPLTCAAMKVKMSIFQKWFNGLYKNNAKYKYQMGKPIYFNKTSRKNVMFLGLDSCERLTYRDKENKGFIDEPQLKEAVCLFKKHGKKKLKIVLMHHNPFPVIEEPADRQTGLENCNNVIVALKNMGAHIILAGHMHRARNVIHFTVTENVPEKIELNTLITGPCCMQYTGRKFHIQESEEILPNRYQVLSVNPSTGIVDLWMRKFSFEIQALKDGRYGDWTEDTDLPYSNSRGRKTIHIWPKGSTNYNNWNKMFGGITNGFKSYLQQGSLRSHISRLKLK